MSGVGEEKCFGIPNKNPVSWHISIRESPGSFNFYMHWCFITKTVSHITRLQFFCISLIFCYLTIC